MSRKCATRRGAVIVAALVCLLIVMALLGAMLQGSLRARRQLPVQRDLRQCELLLDAGIARAEHQFAKDENYRGETWNLPADEAADLDEAQVTITASRESTDQPWQLHVVAEYPLGSEHSIRRSRTITISSPTTQRQE